MKARFLWSSTAIIVSGAMWAWLSFKREATPFRRFPGGNLLAYATQVVPKTKVSFITGYQWTPSGDLYVSGVGDYQGKRLQVTGPLPTRVDGKTGSYAPMTRFLDAADGKPAINGLLDFQNGHSVSPDGRWLVFATHWNNHPVWQVTAGDGSRRLFWPRSELETRTSHAVWTAGTQQWVEAVRRGSSWQFLVHSIGNSGLSTLSVVWPDTLAQSHFDAKKLIGFTHDGSLIARTSDNRSDVFFDFTFSANHADAQYHRVTFPPQAVAAEVVLEPQTDRLAWTFQFDRRSWWSRHLPSQLTTTTPPRETIGICTSRLDGTDMREIAPEYPIGGGPAGTAEWIPFNLRWTPDGKSVSFSFGNALYMVRDR